LTPDQKLQVVRELEVDAERLGRIANRFSDIGSMPKLSVRSVSSVVHQSVEYIERRLPREAGGVELVADVPEGLDAPLNPDLFEWVVENLLKNALDALEDRGGRIEVVGRSSNGTIQLDFTDDGKGIDRRQWKNVFRPGYSTKKRGWGLGLSLARRIVEDYHGGSLTLIRSKPGEGATFRIELPRAVSP
jgi:signal transduction histidine kinase